MKFGDNAIIARISAGLANQMYEFACAYALARELNKELILDITECYNSSWGFLLDYFDIPLYKKIVCDKVCDIELSHTNPKTLPEKFLKEVTVWVEESNNENIVYEGIKMIPKNDYKKNIYLCGYFFNRDKYYDKYWGEIKSNFKISNHYYELEEFKKLIEDKISIGVHIRRGDMLYASWSVSMKDDYYRAAIQYCREKYNDCIFCIFTDDIEYAKKILGFDNDIKYIHVFGYDDAALMEFVCLSMCEHRVLSNSSTFSRLADELSDNKEGHYFVQATATGKQEIKNHLINWYKGNIIREKHEKRIIIDKYDIRRYARKYRYISSYNTREGLSEINVEQIDIDNADSVLKKISQISMNAFDISSESEKDILLKKFIALVKRKKYSSALQTSIKIYETYKNNRVFKENLIDALCSMGFYNEAIIESVNLGIQIDRRIQDDSNLLQRVNLNRKTFVLVPGLPITPTSYTSLFVQLGILLNHLGHKVIIIYEPYDDTEKDYLHKNRTIINRNGADLGLIQYDVSDVLNNGCENFYDSLLEDNLVVISRKSQFFIHKNKKIVNVFLDFSDDRDYEHLTNNMISEEEKRMLYNEADIVFSKNSSLKKDDKVIVWKDNDNKEEIILYEDRWKLGNEHRIRECVIELTATIIENVRLCIREREL